MTSLDVFERRSEQTWAVVFEKSCDRLLFAGEDEGGELSAWIVRALQRVGEHCE